VPVIPDDFSKGRVKEAVEPCMNLASGVVETRGADKAISEPRRELCGIAATVSGDGTPGRDSEDDKLNDDAERR